jgi:hypothetical protein
VTLHIQCTYGRLSPSCPDEWIARAYRGETLLAVGYGETELRAVQHVLTVMGETERLRDEDGAEAPVFSAGRDQREEAAE